MPCSPRLPRPPAVGRDADAVRRGGGGRPGPGSPSRPNVFRVSQPDRLGAGDPPRRRRCLQSALRGGSLSRRRRRGPRGRSFVKDAAVILRLALAAWVVGFWPGGTASRAHGAVVVVANRTG